MFQTVNWPSRSRHWRWCHLISHVWFPIRLPL